MSEFFLKIFTAAERASARLLPRNARGRPKVGAEPRTALASLIPCGHADAISCELGVSLPNLSGKINGILPWQEANIEALKGTVSFEISASHFVVVGERLFSKPFSQKGE